MKNPLSIGIDPTQNGQMAAILDFHYSILHVDHTYYGRHYLVNFDENK